MCVCARACVGDGCRHWERHCSALDSRTQWASKLLQDFQKKLESSGFPPPPSEPREPNTQPLSNTNTQWQRQNLEISLRNITCVRQNDTDCVTFIRKWRVRYKLRRKSGFEETPFQLYGDPCGRSGHPPGFCQHTHSHRFHLKLVLAK